jgi:hypothetical protein
MCNAITVRAIFSVVAALAVAELVPGNFRSCPGFSSYAKYRRNA